MNRETWLENAVKQLDGVFFDGKGYTLPDKIAVSCGFPRGGRRTVGQCWSQTLSDDGTSNIFISPTLSSPLRVLDVLLHELIHAAVGTKAGHRGPFRKLAIEFGLEGKMTATFVKEGSELWEQLTAMLKTLPLYPHAALKPAANSGRKTNGWVRYISKQIPTYTVVVSPNQVLLFGAPRDGQGNEMVEKEKP